MKKKKAKNKKCSLCKEIKSLDSFYSSGSQCKQCRSEAAKKKRAEKATKRKKTNKKCPRCGKTFSPYNSLQKWCSAECSASANHKTRPIKDNGRPPSICKNCGGEFFNYPSRKILYCSAKCKVEYRKAHTKCRVCKRTFEQPKSRRGKVYTCSPECAKQYKKIKPIKTSAVDKNWSEVIRLRAGNKCEYCGGTRAINAHHVFSRSNRAIRWDLQNGVSLCAKHHIFSHEFSAHKNPVEFIEWIKKERGQEWYDTLREKSRGLERMDAREANANLLKVKKELKGLS